MLTSSDTRIAEVRVTPIAFADPPLLNNAGCHEPFALRSIIEVETESGIVGLGESYGSKSVLDALADLVLSLPGLDITDLNGLRRKAQNCFNNHQSFYVENERLLPRVVAAIEVALWDAFGKSTGYRVCDLLGGQVRRSVPFSAYLFYKFGQHFGDYSTDTWGEALSPDGLVEQAGRMKEMYGFGAIKLKAGVFDPEEEIEGLIALNKAFPNSPLRIDPNGGWTVDTTLRLLPKLDGLIEYLEDPTVGIDGNAKVQAATDIPLATNMYVVSQDHLPRNMSADAFRVILSDHHYWGGLQASRELAQICKIWGLGLSMHSNSHLGISLAAMVHLAAATSNLTYDCDTHYPWQTDEIIEGGKLQFRNGALEVPEGPGLGVTLDRAELKRLHQNYLDCGIVNRDDEREMKKHIPDWEFARPKY